MKTKYALPMVLAGSVMLSGCWLDDDDDPITTSVRVLHASSDAPAVNVRVNGNIVVPGADYKQAAVLKPSAGLADIAVDGLLPGGQTATVISAEGVSLRSDTKYDVIAVGKVGDDTIEPLILTDDGARDDANSARLRVAHLSPEAQTAAGGPVDVYVTASGDPLPAEATFSFSFKESVGPLELPASDDYQIRVTPAGSDTVVYDSGQIGLPAGSDLLVAAVDNSGFGNSPISLLVISGASVTDLASADSGAGVRAVHNAADIPTSGDGIETAVDVYINAEPTTDGPTVEDFIFTNTAPSPATLGSYVGLDAGVNRIAVTLANETIPAIDESPDLALGSAYTVIAAGTVADSSVQALVFEDDLRGIATAAKLRVIHGAFEAQVVDVYLVPTAEGGADATEINSASPALDDFEFGQSSGYLEVPAGDYVAFVTTTDGSPLLKTGNITLTAGSVYTAVARVAPEDADNIAGLTLLDDFLTSQPQ